MAIVTMSKVTVALPRRLGGDVTTKLQRLGLIHLRPIKNSTLPEDEDQEAKDDLSQVTKTLAVLDKLFPPKLPFSANFGWPRPKLTNTEYLDLLKSFPANFCSDLLSKADELNVLKETLVRIKNEIQLLQKFQDLPIPTKLPESPRIQYILGKTQTAKLAKLLELNNRNDTAVEVLSKNIALIAVYKDFAKEVTDELSKIGFEPLPIAQSKILVSEQITQLNTELMMQETRKEKILYCIKTDFLPKRNVILAKIDELSSVVDALDTRKLALSSNHALVFIGYTPKSNIVIVKQRIIKLLPDALTFFEDVPDDEEPPVLLSNNTYVRQFEMVTSMYGMPSYRSLDSTPVVSIVFPIFFGFCFGDVMYGLMLLFLSLWFGKIFKNESSGKKFFGTFFWCSIYTIIIGVFTGSWGGNLLEVIAESTKSSIFIGLVNFKTFLTIIDPLKQTITFFVLTLYIGVGSQFLGIILQGWQNIKQGHLKDAILDQGSWLIFLSGLVMFGNHFLGKGLVGWPKTVMLVLLTFGALMLILFQGRSSKKIAGRLGYGLVSLYGILGGYGTASFVGDLMSYSRLLALGLTTSIVAMAFNTMAAMVGFTGFMAIFGFIILVAGHLLNFFLNIIGSFVHPARLTFLEFYTRFFSGGGKPFKPLSKIHSRINVSEEIQ